MLARRSVSQERALLGRPCPTGMASLGTLGSPRLLNPTGTERFVNAVDDARRESFVAGGGVPGAGRLQHRRHQRLDAGGAAGEAHHLPVTSHGVHECTCTCWRPCPIPGSPRLRHRALRARAAALRRRCRPPDRPGHRGTRYGGPGALPPSLGRPAPRHRSRHDQACSRRGCSNVCRSRRPSAIRSTPTSSGQRCAPCRTGSRSIQGSNRGSR